MARRAVAVGQCPQGEILTMQTALWAWRETQAGGFVQLPCSQIFIPHLPRTDSGRSAPGRHTIIMPA